MIELVEFKRDKAQEKMREARLRYVTAQKERESKNRAFLIKNKTKTSRPTTVNKNEDRYEWQR